MAVDLPVVEGMAEVSRILVFLSPKSLPRLCLDTNIPLLSNAKGGGGGSKGGGY